MKSYQCDQNYIDENAKLHERTIILIRIHDFDEIWCI